MSLLKDSGIVLAREMRPILRQPLNIVFAMAQPLVFLALFGPLLAGAMGSGDSPWQWFVPGILVMIGLFSTSTAGSGLMDEVLSGAFERFLVTPISRTSILIGKTMKDVIILLVQAVLIVAVVSPFGFRLYPAGALIGLAILVLCGIGIGSLSYALGIASKRNPYMFWGVQQMLLFPMMLLAGMLLPIESGPQWLYIASRINPLTYIVEAERALFAGNIADISVLIGAAVALVLALVGLRVGTSSIKTALAS